MGLYDFLNRHRNKFLLLGGAAGAVVVVNKILSSYEKQWQNSSSRGFVHEARKKEIHFENIISECNEICQRIASMIIKRLQELLDDTQLIEDLASKKGSTVQSKVEIWKQLRVKILTKILTEIYSTSITVCCMRVQMSVVGGKEFARNAAQDTGAPSSASVADMTSMKTYTKYVALLSTFYDERLNHLISLIEAAVDDTLKGYSFEYKINIQDFKIILDKVKRSLSFSLNSDSSKSQVLIMDPQNLSNIDLSTVLPDSGQLRENDEQTLRLMLAETHDILTSEDFTQVLESSIEVGYALLLDTLLSAFIKMDGKLGSSSGSTSSSAAGDPKFSNPNTIQVPLAKLLPQIRGIHQNRNENEQKALVNHLLCLDVLNCFAANVYEAFCVPK